MKNRVLVLIFAILVTLNWSSRGLSLVESTHQATNEYIAQNSINGFSLKDYLTNNLGFRNGVQEIIIGVEADGVSSKKEIFKWLGYGGFQEDRPGSTKDYLPIVGRPTRSVNHFHNPLGGPWKYSGLDAWVGPSHYTGQSSILWAQNPNQDPGGKWSWYDARGYFYKGLTSTDKTQRDMAMANCFRALGQLMHLIQDASVPAHSRNQIHIGFLYETWIEAMRTSLSDEDRLRFTDFIAKPISFDPSILNLVVPDLLAPITIANIIDTNKYSGSNPDVTAGTAIGIAEYTNANFFSEGTIFSENFPYPNKNTSVDVEDREISDPRGVKPSVKRPYYIKKRDGENTVGNESLAEGKQGYRLATVGFLKDYITKYFPSYMGILKPALDGGVYNDYAEKLLPRAVGYSAGLLQYFFRGNLYVSLLAPSVDQAIYNFGNENDMKRDIGTVAMFIQNSSKLNNVIEAIGQGTISLTIGYFDSRKGKMVYQFAGSGSITDIPDVGTENFLSLLFTLAEPIQTQFAKELTYYLVFKGRLGKEEDAVIGKVIRAPVVQGVSPDQGIEGTEVTITGDYLPEIEGPFPTTSRNVNFSRDPSRPYAAEVINRTDTEIITRVPSTAAIKKPGYGGLRVRRIVPDTEEMIYSNPVPFFPIAEGQIRNLGGVLINPTIEAVKPILGDYSELPRPISYPVPAGDSVWIELVTGFTYKATTVNTSVTQDIWTITPDAVDFVFDLQ